MSRLSTGIFLKDESINFDDKLTGISLIFVTRRLRKRAQSLTIPVYVNVMRVQICSKCKQPRKGHICPYGGDITIKGDDSKVEEDSDSSTRNLSSPQSELSPTLPVINFSTIQEPSNNGQHTTQQVSTAPVAVPSLSTRISQTVHQAYTEHKAEERHQDSGISVNNGVSINGNLNSHQNPPDHILSIPHENFLASGPQIRNFDFTALSDELVQRASRLYQETDALVILYVTGSKNEQSQNSIRRFVSKPLTEHRGMFEEMDHSCIELLDFSKNTQNASHDELIGILTEKTHELYQSRRQLESLKRKLGYM
ncbi:hypothetical protein K7432_006881 [Basidiobolus ranarum]|uniref:Uncharacterized protein n=1 Tax=Basidiobolus ranarum TaxID=34480 RepID=A0ABR2WU62_9FUNG